jgi:hypothetical protein
MTSLNDFPLLSKIAAALGGEVSGQEALVPGPGHSPEDRSLSVKPDPDAPGGFSVHSFAGDDEIACKDYVRSRLGMEPWRPNGKANGHAKAKAAAKPYSPTIATYVYRDKDGQPHHQVRRTADKSFYQSHWDGECWRNGKPKTVVPYKLPELIAASPTTPIYVLEGEKCADLLRAIGFTATSAPGGANAPWAPELIEYFRDRHVRILPDNDDVGRQHAEKVARAIDGVAASVRVIELPLQEEGDDVEQWLQSDRVGARLVQLCEKAPIWQPSAAADEATITELAALPPIAYEKRRKAASKASKRLADPEA